MPTLADQLSPNSHRSRLFWTLKDRLEDSIWVMSSETNPDSNLERYYTRPLDDHPNAGWHPISVQPVTDPPVQSLTVEIANFQQWDDFWTEFHGEDLGGRVFIDKNGEETEESEDEDGNLRTMIRCEGTERPPSVVCEVKASAKERDYVTIHDYVEVVHRFLLLHRDEVLLYMNSEAEFAEPLPKETELVVSNWGGVEEVHIMEAEDWKSYVRGGSVKVKEIPVDPGRH